MASRVGYHEFIVLYKISICRYNQLKLPATANVLSAAGNGTVITHKPIFQDIYKFIES